MTPSALWRTRKSSVPGHVQMFLTDLVVINPAFGGTHGMGSKDTDNLFI